MPRESLIVYLDRKKKKTLNRAAKKDDRSLSAYARRVLEAEADRLDAEKK